MKFLEPLAPHVHWGLRISLAATFLYHGIGKFPVEGFSQNMGMSLPLAWAVTLAEIVGGVALLAGAVVAKDLLTRLGGLIVVVIMIGAIGLVHFKNGFNVMNGGYEFQLLMLVTGLYFLVRGSKV